MGNTTGKIILTPGSVFGSWTILEESLNRSTNRQVKYLCRCGCGLEAEISGHNLRKGFSTSCRSCQHNRRKKHQSFEDINGSYLTKLESHAKTRGIPCDLTVPDLYNQWVDQKGNCALTGWALTLKRGSRDSDATASVDRIDSSGSYTIQNIQWVHKLVNRVKTDLDNDLFIQVCKAVSTKAEETGAKNP